MNTKVKPLTFPILFFAFLFLQTSITHAQINQYEELEGTWDLTVTIEGFDEYSTFVFEVSNDTIMGVWSGDYGPIPISNIYFVQDTLWGNIVIDEADLDITIIGVVSNGIMKGRGLSQMSELFPFTAIKREKNFRRNYYYLLHDFK